MITLDDLEIFVEGPPLEYFTADQAVELLWHDCCTTRRVNQGPRKLYRPRKGKEDIPVCTPLQCLTSRTPIQEVHFVLDDWDEWFISQEDSDVDFSDESNSEL